MRIGRRSSAAALTLCAVLALAGCDQSRGPEVATARGPATAAPDRASGTGAAQRRDRDYDEALRYTRCMNDHGERMDDPVEGKPLPLMGDNHAHAGFAQVPEAFEKCRHLMPATWPVKPDPQYAEQERRYGDCMRRHGVDYPQPDAKGMVRYPADPSVLGRPEYQSADAACRYVIDDSADGGVGE